MKMGDLEMSLRVDVPTKIRFETTVAHEIPVPGLGHSEQAARFLAEKMEQGTTQRDHLLLMGFNLEQADRFLRVAWAAGVDPIVCARYLIRSTGDPASWEW